MALLASLFFSLFTILSTMLQSLNHHRFAIRLTVEAIILKVIFQVIGLGLVMDTDELIKWLSIRYCLCSRLSLYVQRILNSTFSKDQQFFLKNFPLHPDYACSMFCRFLLLNQRLSMESKSYAMIYCVAVGSIMA